MYAKLENGEVVDFPYNIANLYTEHTNVSFPANMNDSILAHFNIVRVVVTGSPDHDPNTHSVEQNGCVYNSERNRWETNWIIREKSAEEIAIHTQVKANEVRGERNRRLADTDWRFRMDMNPSQEWKDYCQALRDITIQTGFPFVVIWPEVPSGN